MIVAGSVRSVFVISSKTFILAVDVTKVHISMDFALFTITVGGLTLLQLNASDYSDLRKFCFVTRRKGLWMCGLAPWKHYTGTKIW